MADILRSGLKPEGPHNTTESDKRIQSVTHTGVNPLGFFLPLFSSKISVTIEWMVFRRTGRTEFFAPVAVRAFPSQPLRARMQRADRREQEATGREWSQNSEEENPFAFAQTYLRSDAPRSVAKRVKAGSRWL